MSEKKLKVFVGVVCEVAPTLAKAQKGYDEGVDHICNEDGNPPSNLLEWVESKEHTVCPDCGKANHKVSGHYCPDKGKVVVTQ